MTWLLTDTMISVSPRENTESPAGISGAGAVDNACDQDISLQVNRFQRLSAVKCLVIYHELNGFRLSVCDGMNRKAAPSCFFMART